MATIERRRLQDGSVSYRAVVRLRGHARERRTFGTRTAAKRWAETTEAAIREGRYSTTREAQRHTLAALIDRYLENHLEGRKAARDPVRCLRWWQQQVGHVFLAKLTPAVVAEQRDALRSGRTAATCNRYVAYLSAALSVAQREWGWVETNPARSVKRLREPRGRVRFLSDEERARLLAACRASGDSRLYPLVVLALATGARRGELLRLEWGDVDFARAMASIRETKNEQSRSVPVAEPALEALRGMGKVRRIGRDLIFAGVDGRALFPRKRWERALAEAGIDGFRFHDLRHSAASYLAMSGASAREIAEVLGHKTLSMVQRYSHLFDTHLAGVVDRMAERFLP